MPKCLKCGALVETLGNCPNCPPTLTRPPQVRPLMREELNRTGGVPLVASRSPFQSLSSIPRTPPPTIGVRASTVPQHVARNGAAPAAQVPKSSPATPRPAVQATPSVASRVAKSPSETVNAGIIQNPAGKPSATKRVPPPVNERASPAKVAPSAQTSVAPMPQPLSRAVPKPIPDPLEQDPAEVLFRPPEPTLLETVAAVSEVRARPAGICRRVLAWLVDATLVLIVLAIYLRAATAILGTRRVASGLKGLDHYVAIIHAWQSILLPGVILGVVLAIAYAAAFAVLRAGATPGRSLMRIRLIDRNGSSPSPTRTIFRAVLSSVSFASFLGGIWLALFDRHRQTLHDRLTSTYVVRLR